MKKILVFMFVLLVVFAMPMTAFAGEVTETATATETEHTFDPDVVAEAESTTDKIMAYIQVHLEELSVIITLCFSVLYQIRKHANLNKSIGTLNNNAISIAENSATAIGTALNGVNKASAVVDGYKINIEALLAEYRTTAEDRRRLEKMLVETENHLKTAKLANVEFANELAELLVLANIPNSKKDELYARHRAAVDAIACAEAEATEVTDDEHEEE
jgi:hypothetical protein